VNVSAGNNAADDAICSHERTLGPSKPQKQGFKLSDYAYA
jgi:hypothetical protein